MDVDLTDVRNRPEVHAALAAMEHGPMSEAVRAALRRYGDLHAGQLRVGAAPRGTQPVPHPEMAASPGR